MPRSIIIVSKHTSVSRGEAAKQYRTEFGIHLRYKNGTAYFVREEYLPFPPFVGLDILDDVLGEFKLDHVAWHTGSAMFLCQATEDRSYWTLAQAKQATKKVGWVEVPEVRELD